ncbi:MAG TPA: CHAT domain-containing protein [Steroidobacteraceae bacterium]
MHHRLQSHLHAEAAARTLFRELIAPISSTLALADIHDLVLMPDDVLRYVPFAALQDGQRYLIESFAVSVVTPAAPARGSPPGEVSRTAAALGVSRTPDGQAWLPNVPAELHRVVRQSPSDRYGALPGIILLDRAFTREAARQVLASGYPVVHIASHFVFRPTSLADSYLLLGDGTHLTLERIKDNTWPLRDVEILTLSACDTAIGDADADGREIESFAAVVQRQGVRSVLASLWSVPDLSTSVLMAKFYATLARSRDSDAAHAAAIRAAQLLLLRGPDRGSLASDQATAHSPYADPYYWAGFVLLRSPT